MDGEKITKNINILLFIEFFKISLFTIGGGLAMVPVIEDVFVRKHNLLKKEDIVEMIAITQTVPGLIAINSSVYVGKKLSGTIGSLVASFAVVLPSFIIIILIASFFPLQNIRNIHVLSAFSCVRACVLGLFIGLFYKIWKSLYKTKYDFLVLFLLLLLLLFNLHPALTVVISCIFGGLYETKIKQKKQDSIKNMTGEKGK